LTSTLSLPPALDVEVGSKYCSTTTLTLGKEKGYPLHRRLGGAQGCSGRVLETSPPPPGIRSPDSPSCSKSLYRLQYRIQTECSLLCMFFWVFPRRQIVVGRRFGTLYQFHLQRLEVDCECSLAYRAQDLKYYVIVTSFTNPI
jgi:hypothetical protein